jgi:anti-sigma factor RsiW
MRCVDSIERIALRLEGELSADLARELEVHLASCARCRAEERMQMLLQQALAAPPEARLSADFTERVIAGALRAAPRRAGPPSRAWSLFAPALLASAAAALWFLFGPEIARVLTRGGASEWIQLFLPLAQPIRSAGAETGGLFAGLLRGAGGGLQVPLPLLVVLSCSSVGLAWGVREVRAWLRA